MQVHGSAVGDGVEELSYELGVEVTDHRRLKGLSLHHEIGASAQVDRAQDQRLVHGKDKESVSLDALLVADSFPDRLTEHNARVFYGVVSVNVKVAFRFQRHVKQAVPCEGVHHMVKKSNAGRQLRFAAAVQAELHGDVGLPCLSVHLRDSLFHDLPPCISLYCTGINHDLKNEQRSNWRVP